MAHKKFPWSIRISGKQSICCLLFPILFCLQFLAADLHAETLNYRDSFRLHLTMNNASVKEVLNSIENQSDFYFLINQSLIDLDRKVDINITNKSIDDVLEELFSSSKVKHEVHGKMIVLTTEEAKKEPLPTAQPSGKTITGTILDQDGQPLPGASVIIAGTTSGSISDIDGNYTIKGVPEGASLQFSFVGTITQVIAVGDRKEISVRLLNDAIGLEEVVAVGYGVQKRSHITGSIASVDSEKLLKTPATNTSSLLAGRLPGMVVTNNSGQPGRDEANISIRGFGNALVIVDGVARDFQQLDPHEIESISILKDASAAVYGARAGNGVVLVTTKRGSRDTKPKINYTGSYSLQSFTCLPHRANAPDYAQYFQTAEMLNGTLPENYTYSDDDIQKYRAGTEPGYRGADWTDLVFRDSSPMQQHNVNISGGTDVVNYFISAGSLNQESLLESGAGVYKRYNISSNVDVNLNENLKVGLNLKYRLEDRDDPGARDTDGKTQEYQRIFRYIGDAKPTIEPIPGEPDMMAYVTEAYQNPIAHTRQDISGFIKDKRKQIDMLWNISYKLPIDGLSVKGRYYMKNYDRTSREVRTPYSVYSHDYTTGENTKMASMTENSVEVKDWSYEEQNTQLSLNYEGAFGDHTISAMGLWENTYVDEYELGAMRKDLISSSIPYLYAGNGVQTNYDLPDENGRKSFVSRINYDYQGKYLLELLFRADASIQFPEDQRWGYFPGASLGWRISEEDFMSNWSALDNLKLRASFASLGYDKISNFDYLAGYELVNDWKYGYGDAMNEATLRSIGVANPNITWENMKIYNLGFDMNLWQGGLGVEFDAFYRLRTGLLQDRAETIPSTVGADLPKENLGERDNRGFEIVLSHRKKLGDFSYGISGNLTWTREKYVYEEERSFDYDDPDDARLNKKTGEWVNRTFGYVTDGFYDTQAEIDNDGLEYEELGAPRIGDIKYVDINGDDIINYRDKKVIGKNATPELFFGLNMDAQYKGFDLSMLWQGAANYDLIVPNNFERAPNLSIGQIPYEFQTKYAWNPDNPSAAKLPAPSLDGPGTFNGVMSDIYVVPGRYIRLKTLNIGYTIPKDITAKVNIDRVRLFFAGYNLFTIQSDNVFEFDPEVKGGDARSTYPPQKSITFGINVQL